jgi:archaellum component FlaC
MAPPAPVVEREIGTAGSLELDDQLFLINEIERLKREHEELQLTVEKLEREKEHFKSKAENVFAMREECEILKEESLFQTEELAKYQRHSASLADEVKIIYLSYAYSFNSTRRRMTIC